MTNNLETLEYFTGAQAESLNEDPRERVELAADEQAKTGLAAPNSGEAADRLREEKIEIWMRNIRDFIRKIDVKAL